MEDWNSEEWQGKRKDQVELSLAIAFLSMLVVGMRNFRKILSSFILPDTSFKGT